MNYCNKENRLKVYVIGKFTFAQTFPEGEEKKHCRKKAKDNFVKDLQVVM